MTKERPILFSGAMVRAILDGTKTQTRRVVKPQPIENPKFAGGAYIPQPKRTFTASQTSGDIAVEADYIHLCCPYGKPGDRLWVRETWAQPVALDPGPTVYRADYPACVPAGFENIPPAEAITWKPSIHMPRALCRLLLEITGVRVERLNDCSEADAIAEGTTPSIVGHDLNHLKYRAGYQTLWDEINGPGAWEANPWVWVVEFRRVTP